MTMKPEWNSDDESIGIKSMVWEMLMGAMLKSVLAGSTANWNYDLVPEMIESRTWLMDESTVKPGAKLDDDMVSGINLNSCLVVLGIDAMVFKRLLCHLWLSEDKMVGSTLWDRLKTARAALKRETGYNSKIRGRSIRSLGLKRCKAAREHAMLMRASEIRKESMRWVEE